MSAPAMVRKVVFPAPDGPMIKTTSRSAIERLTSLRAVTLRSPVV